MPCDRLTDMLIISLSLYYTHLYSEEEYSHILHGIQKTVRILLAEGEGMEGLGI